jgi:diguanylate cyclase (GGDEF)-like protein
MDRLDVRVTRAMELAQSGAPREAVALADELLARAVEADRADLVPRLHYVRAVAHHSLGEHALAISDCERLLTVAEAVDDQGWVSNARSLRACQYVLLGDIDEGVRDLVAAQVALDGLRDGDPLVLAFAHTGLAIGFDLVRLYELALPHYLAPLELPDLGEAQPEARTVDHLNLAEFHLRWGLELERVGDSGPLTAHAATALEHARAAQREAKPLDRDRWRHTADLLTGSALALAGSSAEAVELLRLAVDSVLALDLATEATFGLVFLSRALEDLGRLDDAERAARFADDLLPPDADWPLIASVRDRHARLAAHRSGDPAAQIALHYAETMAREVWRQRLRTLRGAEAQLTLERLRTEHLAAQRASHEDPLTGVANRRHLEQRLHELAETAPPSPYPVSAIMLDVDAFKQINDTLGHQTGDEVLRAITKVLVAHARSSDVVARLGGDEFVVLLTDTGPDEVAIVASRMLEAIRTTNWAAITRGEPVTVSVGTATTMSLRDGAELMALADDAMYVAKRAGGDQLHSI